jgi:catechol 2,3-dioxygenase-like lactoylglutathione lyase family enzyme
MKKVVISGIQQIGIGVSDLKGAWKWYRENFGVDIRVFEEKASAGLMKNYTGGEVRSRHAAMALNLLGGGGGFEIWQYTDRVPQPPKFDIKLGDLGIFAVKIKTRNVRAVYEKFRERKLDLLTDVKKDPSDGEHFFVKDPFGNIFQVVCSKLFFGKRKSLTGATYGAIIGVTDMDKAIKFYNNILGYDKIIYNETGQFDDFGNVPGGDSNMRRVLLSHSAERKGGFSRIFGTSYIELVSIHPEKPQKIFQDRYWGDLGFIHLCYDIRGMKEMKELCKEEGSPFTVDSVSGHDQDVFDMGEAAGHFAYVEDPDGTLIEFVEAHKLPIVKKLGISLNMMKRDPEKALPNWLIKAMKFNKVRK